jgi:tRNA 2-thiouridine synthesizing protein E
MAIEVDGKVFEVDEEGFLEKEEMASWVPEVANVMAKIDNIVLDDNRWEVINFFREFYEEFQISPPARSLNKAIGKKLGKDKGNSKYLYELFPYGPAKQASKYAGLLKPTGCT